ncbi:MAG: right-handed parallel beta-helix repeat-containing protein, partial [Candidatus Cloacimonetes bacterium]|nr:right-handed parallel beta-helix repeat-containing protein [Candidatus Cloacimonadota bacterium]
MKQTILSVLFILIFGSFAVANIINVPADYSSIQEGINASSDGDTVLVQPGSYIENINYNGKNIIVGSLFLTTQDTTFISQTVIDGNQDGSVVTFENEENPESVLCGFTLINGNGNTIFGSRSGGGVFCNNSNPSLLNLIITNNSTESDGGGIFCCINSSPNIENVVISFNSTEEYGGGLCCYDGSNPSLVNVTISDNLAHWGGGGISCFGFCNPSLANITISGNEAYYWAGGGIYCDFYCSPSFENVTVSYNKAVAGGGINFYYGCTPVFDSDNRCNIYSNFADYANDLFIDYCQIINVIVDTFTVLNPTNFHAHPVENCTFDILNGRLQQVDSDLYVAPDGSNSNSGLSFDYPLKTIRYAYSIIDVNSSNYHSIYLAPGIYSQDTADEYFPVGCINFVSLEGSGEDETILDAGGMKRVLCFNRANEVTVKGISVKNGYSACGGGISCYKSSPNLLDMKILNNTANDGGGIFCYANCNPILENVTIIGNTANADGGAIHFWNNCHLTLINVTISNNSANRGGGIYNFYNSNMIIVNSILWNDLPDEIQGSANAFYSD